MAKRFYFPDGISSEVTPPAPVGSTTWEHINASGNVTQRLLEDADTTALASVTYTPDAADDITDKDSCHRQYVSGSLLAQTLTGNIKGQFQCSEGHANNNLFITLKVLVCSNDGSTTRATLLAITRATSLETTTTLTNRTFPSTALTNYTCVQGDRLVIEVGLGGNITTATGGVQGHNGTIRWGGTASSGDLPINETEAGTTFRPWVEFSTAPVMEPVPTIATQRASSLGSIAATWASVIAVPLLAAVLLQAPAVAVTPDNPPPKNDKQYVTLSTWPQPDWPSQRTGPLTRTGPEVYPVSRTEWGQRIVQQWPQPDWPTQVTKKVAYTGPEVYPMPKTDWGQAIVRQWPQPAWETQVTKKVAYTGPEVFPMPKTDWGQAIVRQWPQPEWPTQITRKVAYTGPEVYPMPKTDWGQAIVRQWPQPDWPTQTTRKVSTTGPEVYPVSRTEWGQRIVAQWSQPDWPTQRAPNAPMPSVAADNPPPHTISYPILARWSEVTALPLTQTVGLQNGTADVIPDNPPPKPPFPASLYASWEPRPLEPVWGWRITTDNPQPYTRAPSTPIWMWEPLTWETQQTRKVPTSGTDTVQPAFSRMPSLPIHQWSQPDWPTQVTRKVSTTGPEVHPVSRTEWGQRIVAQWPSAEWPTQITKKLAYTGPETHPMPKTDAGQRSVSQWPQPEWSSQTTRKVSTGTVTNSLTLPETVVLTESFIKQVNRAIGETVALAEAFVVSLFRPMAETVVLTEQLQESVIPSGSSTLPPMVHLSVRIGIRIG